MPKHCVLLPPKIETECHLCKRMLLLDTVRRGDPDFCIACYMVKIHPKVEEIIRNTPAGQRVPEHCQLVKQILSGL